MKAMDNIAASTAADTTDMKIGDDNVGNKMLQVKKKRKKSEIYKSIIIVFTVLWICFN